MKVSHVLPLAALSTAFVLPPQEVINEIAIEDNHRGNQWYEEALEVKDDWLSSFKKHFDDVTETTKDAWQSATTQYTSAVDQAFEYADDAMADWQAWLDTEMLDDPHHGPPHHGKPGRDRPHHPHHGHGKPNQTVYQLISESKYTTELAKLINKYDDLVEALNSTKANYTVFAPTDKAFEKIPKHAPKPSEEQLKDILSYHVIPDFCKHQRHKLTVIRFSC